MVHFSLLFGHNLNKGRNHAIKLSIEATALANRCPAATTRDSAHLSQLRQNRTRTATLSLDAGPCLPPSPPPPHCAPISSTSGAPLLRRDIEGTATGQLRPPRNHKTPQLELSVVGAEEMNDWDSWMGWRKETQTREQLVYQSKKQTKNTKTSYRNWNCGSPLSSPQHRTVLHPCPFLRN